MSGPLPQYRTPSRPTGEIKGFKHVLRPGGVHKDGRCVEWIIDYEIVFKHVLVYPPEQHRQSKHARGRIRKLDKGKRTRLLNMRRRAVQAQKSATIDANKWHMMIPG